MAENSKKIIDLLATRHSENIRLAFALMASASSTDVLTAKQVRPYYRAYLPTLLRYVPGLLAKEQAITLVDQIIDENWVSDWTALKALKTVTFKKLKLHPKHRLWEALSTLPALETLFLQDIRLEGAFTQGLPFAKLKRLWLTAIELEDINKFCTLFENTPQIEELRIYNLKFSKVLHHWTSNYLPQLKSLYIHHTNIHYSLKRFPPGILSLKQLEHLSLGFHNKADFTFPIEIRELKNLKTMEIKGIHLHRSKQIQVEEQLRKFLPNCELIIL
ncbi:MAG: hypothetical protein MK212_05980 [Saprospiraceae bacterium]|nr:hypothetical protein [Saprospiraceae bacterium]